MKFKTNTAVRVNLTAQEVRNILIDVVRFTYADFPKDCDIKVCMDCQGGAVFTWNGAIETCE